MQPSMMNVGPTRAMAETVQILEKTTCAAPPTGTIMSGRVILLTDRAHDALPPAMPPA